jgi:hypothetical protein
MTTQNTEEVFLPCILQLTTDRFKPVSDLTFPTIDDYAAKFGIPVKRILIEGDQTASFIARRKINAIIQVLSMGFSHCIWIDADAYINNPLPITDFVDDQHDLFISKDINGINAGVMVLHQSAIPFLKQVLKDPFDHVWVEQMAMIRLIEKGYPVVIKYLNQSAFQAYFYDLYDMTFPEGEATKDSFIIHLPGLSIDQRIALCNAKRGFNLSDGL